MVTKQEIEILKTMLDDVFQKLIGNDSSLIDLPEDTQILKYKDYDEKIDRKLHEICINHRVAVYIEEYINKNFEQKYFVDIEYNRYYKNKKYLPIDGIDNIIRPDIIVHTRTQKTKDTQHYLVIEAKKDIDSEEDKKVICSFLNDPHYNYKFGLTIKYQNFNPIEVHLFYVDQDCEKIKCEKLSYSKTR